MHNLFGRAIKAFRFFSCTACFFIFLCSGELKAYTNRCSISLWSEACELARERKYGHALVLFEKAQNMTEAEEIFKSSKRIYCILADRIACLLSCERYDEALVLAKRLVDPDVPANLRCYGLQAMVKCLGERGEKERRLCLLGNLSRCSTRSPSVYVMPELVILAPSSPAFNASTIQTEKAHEILEKICKVQIPKPTYSESEVVFFKIPATENIDQLADNELWLTEFDSPAEVLRISKQYRPKCFSVWERVCSLNSKKQKTLSRELFRKAFKEMYVICKNKQNQDVRNLLSCLLLDGGVTFNKSFDPEVPSTWMSISLAFPNNNNNSGLKEFPSESIGTLIDTKPEKPFNLSRFMIFKSLKDKAGFWSQKEFDLTKNCNGDRFIISSCDDEDVALIESACQMAITKLIKAMNTRVDPSTGLALGEFAISTPSGSILILKERAREDIEKFFEDYINDMIKAQNERGLWPDESDMLLLIADRQSVDL